MHVQMTAIRYITRELFLELVTLLEPTLTTSYNLVREIKKVSEDRGRSQVRKI